MLTIGYMPHQLEVLPLLEDRLARHDTVILEEPSSPLFEPMLARKIPIAEYLQDMDPQFPQFETLLCRMIRDFREHGKNFLQVDPYMEVLGAIHDHFAEGATVERILADPVMTPVYLREREATGRLIQFYHHSSVRPFDDVVASVMAFAMSDARRIVLRDRMRAERIAEIRNPAQSTYIETGYIHYTLYSSLRRKLPRSVPIHVDFLLSPVVRSLGGKRRNISPGDVLTLNYAMGKGLPVEYQRLLAARSLIYIKMIHKEEMPGSKGDYPVTRHEIFVNRLVDALSYDDCQMLYARVKHVDPAAACDSVLKHLAPRRTEGGMR